MLAALLVGQLFAMEDAAVEGEIDFSVGLDLRCCNLVSEFRGGKVFEFPMPLLKGGIVENSKSRLCRYTVGGVLHTLRFVEDQDFRTLREPLQKATGAFSDVPDYKKWEANIGVIGARIDQHCVRRVGVFKGDELLGTYVAGIMPGAIFPALVKVVDGEAAEYRFASGQGKIATVYRGVFPGAEETYEKGKGSSYTLDDSNEVDIADTTWSIPSISAATFGPLGWDLGAEYVVKTYVAAFHMFRGVPVFDTGRGNLSNCFIAQVHDTSSFDEERIAAINSMLEGTDLSFNVGPFNYFPKQDDGRRSLFIGKY